MGRRERESEPIYFVQIIHIYFLNRRSIPSHLFFFSFSFRFLLDTLRMKLKTIYLSSPHLIPILPPSTTLHPPNPPFRSPPFSLSYLSRKGAGVVVGETKAGRQTRETRERHPSRCGPEGEKGFEIRWTCSWRGRNFLQVLDPGKKRLGRRYLIGVRGLG